MLLGGATETDIHQEYSDRDFQALGIDQWDGPLSGVENFGSIAGITYPLLQNGSATGTDYEVYLQFLVIDPDGIVRYVSPQEILNVQTVRDTIEAYLSSPAENTPPAELPETFSLSQNYPNPFNPATHIEFSLPQSVPTQLSVYNQLGQEVTTLVSSTLPAGRHTVEFNGSRLPSGFYFYRLNAGSFSETRKMILMK